MLSESEIVYRALLQITFGVSALMGKEETGSATSDDKLRLRLLTPVVKTFCARLAAREMLNLIESWGGQGYMLENEFGTLIQVGQPSFGVKIVF
jgi:alkylation response protein AidB-like acyl-CoA dehydrogenase